MKKTTEKTSKGQSLVRLPEIGVNALADEKTYRQRWLETDLTRWRKVLDSVGMDPMRPVSDEIGRLLLCSHVDYENDPEHILDKGTVVVELNIAYLDQVEKVLNIIGEDRRKRVMSQLKLVRGEADGFLSAYDTTGDESLGIGIHNHELPTNRGTP